MKRSLAGAPLVALLVAALIVPSASGGTAKVGDALPKPDLSQLAPTAVPGEILVRFKGSAHVSARSVASIGGRIQSRPTKDIALVRAPAGVPAEALLARYRSDPSVAAAELNLLRYTAAIPDDPFFDEQWGLSNTGQAHPISGTNQTRAGVMDADINAPEAWDVEQGNAETVIAIMDSGVDVTHPDLAAGIWTNLDEIPGNSIDDDANGFVDDVNGWDFADDDNSLIQSTGDYAGWDHGTHVAGIAGAQMNNATGIAGVCPGCKLMVLKVFEPFDTDGDGIKDTMVSDIASALRAFDYAIEMGADVVNGSFIGSVITSRFERAKVEEGIENGITPVFAAGNEDGDNDLLATIDFDGDGVFEIASPSYPASYDVPGLISVGASNDRDEHGYSTACFLQEATRNLPCAFTNWGRYSVDVSAPGVDVLSTLPEDSYDVFDGTSMAAPHVAGVAGLILSRHPEYSPVQVRNAIMNAADERASLHQISPFPGVPRITGDLTRTLGRVDAAASLDASTASGFSRSNSNIAGARRLRPVARGRVAWPEDVNDVFKKRLRKGVRYKVVLDGARRGADLDVQVYKPGTTDIWQLDQSCLTGGRCQILYYNPSTSGDDRVRFRARKTGRYYFHVNAWFLNEGRYTLKVTRI